MSALPSRPSPVGQTTVVVMTHNYARYLGQALESVLAQTRQAARVVVVDDASDDDPLSVVRPFLGNIEFHRVDYRSQQQTRNYGLTLAHSKYVLFLDADDYMAPDMLERLEHALDTHAKARLAYCDKHVFGNGDAMAKLGLEPHWRAGKFSLSLLRFRNFVMATSLIRRNCIQAFDERIVRLTDWDTWLGILQDEAHAVYVSQPLLHYRVHGENVSIRRRELVERLKILVKHGLMQHGELSTPAPASAQQRKVVLLARGAEAAEPAHWQLLAQRYGWTLRVLAALPLQVGADPNAQTLQRAGRVMVQAAPSPDIEDQLRRYAGVVTDPTVDAVVVANSPQQVSAATVYFVGTGPALRCDGTTDRILSCSTLEELGAFALSPAAARLLLYLPPPQPLGPLGRLRHAAQSLVSQHLTWRLRRTVPTSEHSVRP